MKKTRILRPNHLSPVDIQNLILDINIQAIESLEQDNSLDKWALLLDNFNSSIPEAKSRASRIKAMFQDWRDSGNGLPIKLLTLLNRNWFNTLRSTLYRVEGYLIEGNLESFWEVWEIFNEVERLRTDNYTGALSVDVQLSKRLTKKS